MQVGCQGEVLYSESGEVLEQLPREAVDAPSIPGGVQGRAGWGSSSPAAPEWMANGNAVPTLPRGEGGKGDALRPAPPHLLCWEEAAVLLEAAPTAPSLPTGLSAVPG